MGPNQIYKLLYNKESIKKKKKMKQQPMEWEKIVANNATNKGLIMKIYKQQQQNTQSD